MKQNIKLNPLQENSTKYTVIKYLDHFNFNAKFSELSAYINQYIFFNTFNNFEIQTLVMSYLKLLPYITVNGDQISKNSNFNFGKRKKEWDSNSFLNDYYHIFYPIFDEKQSKIMELLFDFEALEWRYEWEAFNLEYDIQNPRYENGDLVELDSDDFLEEMIEDSDENNNTSIPPVQENWIKKNVFFLIKIALFGKDFYKRSRKRDKSKNIYSYIDFIMEQGDEQNISVPRVVEFIKKEGEKLLLEVENQAKRKNIKKYYKLIDSKYDNTSIDEDDESQL
jgi:hypothetical protein